LATALTARDVQEALEERISTGFYGRGERLPPVRSIAAEFGTSPSTVSRALQEMVRSGWLEVHERQFVRVRRKLARNSMRRTDLQRTVKAMAHKWKLWGGSEDELIDMIREHVGEVFASRPNLVFTECNAHDLDLMGKRLAEGLPGTPIARSLIADLDRSALQKSNAVVLVPYYHYTEVKAIVGKKVPIVPVHTSPSVQTLDELLTISPGQHVLIVGHNKRSIARLSGMVHDYVEDAEITGVTLHEPAKIKRLAPAVDVVVAVKSAIDVMPDLSGHRRLIEVRFTLEPSTGNRLGRGDFHQRAFGETPSDRRGAERRPLNGR
jgi:DNA-binding transcriptional regulator YhcF (GntR family)